MTWLHVFLLPGTSTAQVVAVNDWVEKRPRIITESVCQQHIGAGSKRARKLGKRRILESKAEYGKSAFLLLYCPQNAIHWRPKAFFALANLQEF